MPPLNSDSSVVVVCCDDNENDYIMHSQDEQHQSSSSQPWWLSSSDNYVEEFDNEDVSRCRRRCSSSDYLLSMPYDDQWQQQSKTKEQQPQRQRQRQRRVVRFNEIEQIQTTISRTDYAEQEISQCWFTLQDYIDFKKDVAVTVYLMMEMEMESSSYSIDDIMYTSRGAECRIPEIWHRRHQWRLDSKQPVLEIEQNLRVDNIDLEKGMLPRSIPYDAAAHVYWEVSQPAVYEAIRIASIDRIDADSYYNNTKQDEDDNDDDDWLSDDWISSVSSTLTSFSLDDNDDDDDDDDCFETMKPEDNSHHPTIVGLTTTCAVDDGNDNDDQFFCDSWIREVAAVAA